MSAAKFKELVNTLHAYTTELADIKYNKNYFYLLTNQQQEPKRLGGGAIEATPLTLTHFTLH
jgi:hypothetical protein